MTFVRLLPPSACFQPPDKLQTRATADKLQTTDSGEKTHRQSDFVNHVSLCTSAPRQPPESISGAVAVYTSSGGAHYDACAPSAQRRVARKSINRRSRRPRWRWHLSISLPWEIIVVTFNGRDGGTRTLGEQCRDRAAMLCGVRS